MTTAQIIFSIYIYAMLATYFITLPRIFDKLGRPSWEGYVPVYNFYIALKLMKRPWWWMIFFIMPGINFLMMIICNVEMGRTFRKFHWKETLTQIFLPHWTYFDLAFKDATYFGDTDWAIEEQRKERELSDHVALFFTVPFLGHALYYAFGFMYKDKPKKKSRTAEWVSAILFAIVAASGIRTYVFEAYTIPTPSMEKNMLVGDYLFVSKLHYGPKLPNTPLAIPFVHNTIPLINTKSYVEWWKIEHTRLPGFSEVKRNDVMVFNFPAGDTAINDPGVEGLMGHTFSKIRDEIAMYEMYMKSSNKANFNPADFYKNPGPFRKIANNYLEEEYGLIRRPVDKRENYIKRCVGIPGDKIQIIDDQLIVNGKNAPHFEGLQFNYLVDRKIVNQGLLDGMREEYDLIFNRDIGLNRTQDSVIMPLTKEAYDFIKSKTQPVKYKMNPQIISGFGTNERLGRASADIRLLYPNHPKYVDWTVNNYGPIWVPKKGAKIELTEENVILYGRCITVFEGHTLTQKDGKVFIDGEEEKEYKFEMNYYWLMGDNRHNSADSRFWGFVPEDHVVGKAVLIWMSVDPEYGFFKGGIRWDRVFKWAG
jgi:signal peptidase I